MIFPGSVCVRLGRMDMLSKGEELKKTWRMYSGCNCKKYVDSKGCTVNPSDICLSIHFLHLKYGIGVCDDCCCRDRFSTFSCPPNVPKGGNNSLML